MQELRIKETDTRIETEVGAIRGTLEAVKFSTLQWLSKYFHSWPKRIYWSVILNLWDSWCVHRYGGIDFGCVAAVGVEGAREALCCIDEREHHSYTSKLDAHSVHVQE